MDNSLIILHNSKELDVYEIKDHIYPLLLQRKDQSEKEGKSSFETFSDEDMLYYFLFREKNLDISKNKSLRTLNEYQRELKQMVTHMVQYAAEINLDFNEIIEGSLFKSLQTRHLRRFQKWTAEMSPYVLRKGAYSPATLARKTTIWKSFFLFLYQSKYIKEPVHEGLLSATVRKDDRPNRDLGPKEVIQLLDYYKKHEHPIMFGILHVLVSTGIRNEEFCRLTVSDMKYDSILGGHYLSVIGKGNKRRSIPLKEKVVKSINVYRESRVVPMIEEADGTEPLFPTGTGRAFSPSYLAQYLKEQIQKTDLSFVKERPITAHVFRHSFAIISHQAGADLYKIMRSLGHSKVETTMIYLHNIYEREQHAIHEWKDDALGDYI